MLGPIVLTAVFLPSSWCLETLLRYDIAFFKSSGASNRETISDLARYNRILTLNRSELGYQIKAFSPEEFTNIL